MPVSYSVATTRMPQDITDPKSYKQLSLGADNIYLQPAEGDDPVIDRRIHRRAARPQEGDRPLQPARRRRAVPVAEPVSRDASRWRRNVPVGTHKARAFLFKNGLFVKETSAQLAIVKSGFEQSIFHFAHDYSFVYGLLCGGAGDADGLARQHRLPQGLAF